VEPEEDRTWKREASKRSLPELRRASGCWRLSESNKPCELRKSGIPDAHEIPAPARGKSNIVSLVVRSQVPSANERGREPASNPRDAGPVLRHRMSLREAPRPSLPTPSYRYRAPSARFQRTNSPQTTAILFALSTVLATCSKLNCVESSFSPPSFKHTDGYGGRADSVGGSIPPKERIGRGTEAIEEARGVG
jgi:hypothetical protein